MQGVDENCKAWMQGVETGSAVGPDSMARFDDLTVPTCRAEGLGSERVIGFADGFFRFRHLILSHMPRPTRGSSHPRPIAGSRLAGSVADSRTRMTGAVDPDGDMVSVDRQPQVAETGTIEEPAGIGEYVPRKATQPPPDRRDLALVVPNCGRIASAVPPTY